MTHTKFSARSGPTCRIQNLKKKLPWRSFKKQMIKMIKEPENKPHNKELK